jgi:hypothetical protein
MAEQIATSTTGGQKGRKSEQYSLIPTEFLAEVARVYSYGAEKYSRDNWLSGYPWSWSYDALQRHIIAFWSGQETDPESGRHHLAHAAFHLASLFTYSEQTRYVEHDDRPQAVEPVIETPVIALKKNFSAGDEVLARLGNGQVTRATLMRPAGSGWWEVGVPGYRNVLCPEESLQAVMEPKFKPGDLVDVTYNEFFFRGKLVVQHQDGLWRVMRLDPGPNREYYFCREDCLVHV